MVKDTYGKEEPGRKNFKRHRAEEKDESEAGIDLHK